MLKKISPEAAGISSKTLERYLKVLDKYDARMHSVLMMKGDSLFLEAYWKPFDKDFCHRMYSQTKSYTAIAVGLAADDGLINLDDRIVDYFRDKLTTPICDNLKNQTIRQMLTMTTVLDRAYWFDYPVCDRAELYFRKGESTRAAGGAWSYDSAGSQLLCALVERVTGKSLFDYLNERIFKKLGCFKTAEMLKVPTGECWGDSALICTPRDMITFARFVMNGGSWNGEQLISRDFVRKATTKQVDNIDGTHGKILSHGYGYQIWMTQCGGFAFVGMGDQLTICLPEKDLIFVCTADNQGSAAIRHHIISNFFEMVAEEIQPSSLPECREAFDSLEAHIASLELFSLKGALKDSPFRTELDGAVYDCSDNPMGMKSFSVEFEGSEGGVLRYFNEGGEMVLPFYVDKNRFGEFPELGYSQDFGGVRTTDGSKYKDAVSFAWLDEKKFMIHAQIIDRYFGHTTLIFSFVDLQATVQANKVAEDFLWNYSGETFATRR